MVSFPSSSIPCSSSPIDLSSSLPPAAASPSLPVDTSSSFPKTREEMVKAINKFYVDISAFNELPIYSRCDNQINSDSRKISEIDTSLRCEVIKVRKQLNKLVDNIRKTHSIPSSSKRKLSASATTTLTTSTTTLTTTSLNTTSLISYPMVPISPESNKKSRPNPNTEIPTPTPPTPAMVLTDSLENTSSFSLANSSSSSSIDIAETTKTTVSIIEMAAADILNSINSSPIPSSSLSSSSGSSPASNTPPSSPTSVSTETDETIDEELPIRERTERDESLVQELKKKLTPEGYAKLKDMSEIDRIHTIYKVTPKDWVKYAKATRLFGSKPQSWYYRRQQFVRNTYGITKPFQQSDEEMAEGNKIMKTYMDCLKNHEKNWRKHFFSFFPEKDSAKLDNKRKNLLSLSRKYGGYIYKGTDYELRIEEYPISTGPESTEKPTLSPYIASSISQIKLMIQEDMPDDLKVFLIFITAGVSGQWTKCLPSFFPNEENPARFIALLETMKATQKDKGYLTFNYPGYDNKKSYLLPEIAVPVDDSSTTLLESLLNNST